MTPPKPNAREMSEIIAGRKGTPPKPQVSAGAERITSGISYMLPDTEACREKVAAYIDAELKPLLDAAQHVVADNYPSVIAMRMLRDELAKWAGE